MSEAARIRGSESRSLEGRSVLLGVTASVALYRSIDLARSLMRRGALVKVVMSREAGRLASPDLFEWATGSRAVIEFRGLESHIDLAEQADIMVVAPATANTIAKIAAGVTDTSVSLAAQTMLGMGKPLLIAPAMNLALYRSPALQAALERLRSYGAVVVEPLIEEGKAKYPPVEEIAWRAEALVLRGLDLGGRRILVTAGPTREYLDSIRFLSNPSTGKMGVYLAAEAAYRGAEVYLVHGPLSARPPRGPVETVEVETTEEMLDAVLGIAGRTRLDAAILAAAPADYGFAEKRQGKIPSDAGEIRVVLRPTPKIVSELRRASPSTLIVGFAAEAVDSLDELEARAREKMDKRGMDMVVGNSVAGREAGFGAEFLEAVIIEKGGEPRRLGRIGKREAARLILDRVRELLGGGS